MTGTYKHRNHCKDNCDSVWYGSLHYISDKAASDNISVGLKSKQKTRSTYAKGVYQSHLYRLKQERKLYEYKNKGKYEAVNGF